MRLDWIGHPNSIGTSALCDSYNIGKMRFICIHLQGKVVWTDGSSVDYTSPVPGGQLQDGCYCLQPTGNFREKGFWIVQDSVQKVDTSCASLKCIEARSNNNKEGVTPANASGTRSAD